MNNNIFEGAKFGDKFVTRNNKVLIYLYSILEHSFFIMLYNEKLAIKIEYDNNTGYCIDKVAMPESDYDIVSRYQEPIDEEKLDELANKLCPLEGFSNAEEGFIDEREDLEDSWVDGFKAGYRKAKEE